MADRAQLGASPQGGVVRAKPRVPLGTAPSAAWAPATTVVNPFFYGGGRLLNGVRVHLIFWGTAWVSSTPPSPSMGACVDAVQRVMSSDYLDAASQYGVLRGTLASVCVVADPVGGSPETPPNPFAEDDVWQLVDHLRVAGRIPTSDIGNDAEGLFVVVMPSGVAGPDPLVIGEHSYYWFGSTNVPYAWVTHNSLDLFSQIFSHELVEAVTDPEGTGWTSLLACGPDHSGWCEIGDICEGNTAWVNGVLVQRYWSQRDAQCVVTDDAKPQKDSKDVVDKPKDHKDTKDTKEHKEHKDGKDKDGHKEADHPPVIAGTVAEQLRRVAQQLADLAGGIESPGSETAFIEPAERPTVGDA